MYPNLSNLNRKNLVNELVKQIAEEVIASIPKMPENWDGVEIRQFICDKAKAVLNPRMTNARKSQYKNNLVVRKL
jgi:hypothetical protein